MEDTMRNKIQDKNEECTIIKIGVHVRKEIKLHDENENLQ